uniref:PiggyBac transposable element-derived protein domain-containing protein n=1 Tax=Homalodisca liturata TaxID=320908 RepID=A0A1B6JK84_9HEMI
MKWEKRYKTVHRLKPEPNYSEFNNKTPTELFELFFCNDIIELLVKESITYRRQKNNNNISVCYEEMKCFLAILLLSGYKQVPSKRNYWENELDVKNSFVSEAMRRDRFFYIMRYLHCADCSKLDADDRYSKLRPMLNILKKGFLDEYKGDTELSLMSR